MTIKDKTPAARSAARSYCRRCLAVMLCCVLVFGLTVRTAPRAEAAAVDGTSAVEVMGGPNLTVLEGGASGGTSPAGNGVTGGTVGAFLLAACGVNMLVDSVEYSSTRYYGGTVYDEGNELWAYLYDLGGDIADWCIKGAPSGSIHPGDSFTVPAEVLEATRSWALDHLDFIDGVCTYQDSGLFNEDGNCFVLCDVDTSQLDASTSSSALQCNVRNMGSLVKFHAGDYSQPYEVKDYITDDIYCVSRYTFTEPAYEGGSWSGSYSQHWYLPGFRDDSSVEAGIAGGLKAFSSKEAIISRVEESVSNPNMFGVLFSSPGKNRLYCGTYQGWDGRVRAGPKNYCDLDAVPLKTSGTTLTKTDALDQPKTEELTITIPPQLPTTQVGELTIPVITEISGSDLTEIGGEENPGTDPAPGSNLTPGQITDAITDALPVTGAAAGDAVVGEAMAEPDSLGAVFISKFPFSIPWDIVKAFELLAAPPVTPRWELDFMAPIAYRVGGFEGDTTVVLDFSDYEIVGQVTRWVSTLMFVYALASGTKRLIWTA